MMKLIRKKDYYFCLMVLLGMVIYYLFPPFFRDETVLTMGLLFFINPIYNIVASMLYTVKFGMQLYVPISLALLFLPSAFFFYGLSYLYYVIFYFAASLCGCCIGYPIWKRYQ